MHSKTTSLYRHYDKQGRLLYVGVSLDAFSRFLQHGRATAEVARMDVETFQTRRDALRAERKAIESENPLHNVQHARAAPRVKGRTSMLSVRVPNELMDGIDEACRDGLFRDRTEAVVKTLSEILRKHDMIDDAP
jgi:hypothetical protein